MTNGLSSNNDVVKTADLEGRRRRSSSDLLRDKFHSPFMSTLALCGSAFAMFFLLFSVFPYSGFMVMHLVSGVDRENAGLYAGFLSSAFMVGRAFSSYLWGKIADIYGRKFVLVISLLVSAVGSIAFGCSTSFAMAVSVRFVIGLGNGTMIVCRTAVSELARGDRELESKSVGFLMSMVGYGMLISPALGGSLSEPLRQYPNANILDGKFDQLLESYPFLPPNLISSLLSMLSLINVILSVEETLPDEKRRHWLHAGEDLASYMIDLAYKLLPCSQSSALKVLPLGVPDKSTILSQRHNEDEEVWEDGVQVLGSKDFAAKNATLMPTRNSCAWLGRRSNDQPTDIGKADEVPDETTALDPNASSNSEQASKKESIVSMSSILANPDTRVYLVAYWINAFASVAQSEVLPLFAMSHLGGLGLEEKFIGTVGTLSGLMFCVGQYFAFTQAMRLFGLLRALRLGAFFGHVPVILMPISLFLSGWVQILYLAFISGVLMIFNSVYLGCNTIGSNRTVDSTQRAAMNGLSSLGTSIGRGLGPIVAGFLVAFSMTSGIIPPDLGGWFIYVVLGMMGLAAYWSTRWISDET